jgi:hypothetical protein
MIVTQVLLEAAARSLAMAVLAGAALWILRVRSAPVRHLVWTSVLAGSLCMPFLPEALRRVAPAAVNEHAVTVISVPVQQALPASSLGLTTRVDLPAPSPAVDPVLAVYLAVSATLLVRFGIGLTLTWGIARRATPLAGFGNTRISEELRTPVTFGRTVLLPANVHMWSEETLGAVLRHEEAHCRRGDFYVQALSKIHRAVFWFNPAAWWMDRELADLAEQSCDAAAVRSQEECPTYAELLVQFATKSRLSTEAGVAMARLSSVSKRVSHLLDGAFEPGEAHLPASRKWKVLTSSSLLILTAAAFTVVLDAQPPVPPAPAAGGQSPAARPRPANTPKPPKPPSAARIQWDSDGSSFILVENGNSVMMNGSSDDLRAARGLNLTPPYIWFKKDGKAYVVKDPQTLEQIKAMLKPQDDLGKMQAELGEQQSRLGEEQRKLGEQMAGVSVEMPDLSQEVRKLGERLVEIRKRKAEMSELGDLQAKLGELQAVMGELQGRAGARQGELGKLQAELGAKQAVLGEKQAELGAKQAEIAHKVSAEISARRDEWIRSGKATPLPQ